MGRIYFERRLQGFAKNIIVMRGGMGKNQWKRIQEKIKSIPDDQEHFDMSEPMPL